MSLCPADVPTLDAPDTIRSNVDELISVTHHLGEVVEEVGVQIKALKEERADTTGDVKNAYDLVIANKVWILQTLIGEYWRKTLTLTLDDSTPKSNASA